MSRKSRDSRNPMPMGRLINSVILKQGGELNINTLYDQLINMDDVKISFTSLLKLLKKFKNVFVLFDGRMTMARTLTNISKIRICPGHAKKEGSCHVNDGECGGLHICKIYLLSEHCQFQSDCLFGHDHTSTHNRRVFKYHFIEPDHFDIDQLRNVFRQIKNRNFTTMPDTCKFYNTSKTCKNENCRSLHLCRHFLEGTCKFAKSCKRNHNNIRDEVILQILSDYGFDISLPTNEILEELQHFYKNKTPSITSHPSNKRKSGLSERFGGKCSKLDGNDGKLFKPRNTTQSSSCPSRSSRQPSSIVGQLSGTACRASTSLSNLQKESTTICIHHLRGNCLFGSECLNHHKSMIYMWQWKSDGDADWTDFAQDHNLQLEKSFCGKKRYEYINMSGNIERVDFDTMTASGGYIGCVQRLSTISSKNAPASIQKWTTQWQWYWMDERDNWKKYGEPDLHGNGCGVASEEVEEKYLANPAGFIMFANNTDNYVLLFPKLQQTNIKTQTKRHVQRRPKFFTCSDVESRTTGSVSSDISKSLVPQEWSMDGGSDVFKHYRVVKVPKNSREFEVIDDLFHKTLSQKTIISLERIENGELWNSYCTKKDQMMRKLGEDVEERQLFHGTNSKNIEAICRQGFDFRFCGKAVGTLHGKGSYFATTASYSDSYTDDSRKMFVAKTLVGNFTKGNPSYVRPPPKHICEPHGDLFDSCVDKVEKPGIFVIFDLYQVYPQYLITYQ